MSTERIQPRWSHWRLLPHSRCQVCGMRIVQTRRYRSRVWVDASTWLAGSAVCWREVVPGTTGRLLHRHTPGRFPTPRPWRSRPQPPTL